MTDPILHSKTSTPQSLEAPEPTKQEQLDSLKGKEATTDTPSTTRLSQWQKWKDALAKPFRAYPEVRMVAVARREVDYVAKLNRELTQQLNKKGVLGNYPHLLSKANKLTDRFGIVTDVVKKYDGEQSQKMTEMDASIYDIHIRGTMREYKELVAAAGPALSSRKAQEKKGEGSRFSKLESVYQGLKRFLSGLFAERQVTTLKVANSKIKSLTAQITRLDKTPPRREYEGKDDEIGMAFDYITDLKESIENAKKSDRNELNKDEIEGFKKAFRDLKVLIKIMKKDNS